MNGYYTVTDFVEDNMPLVTDKNVYSNMISDSINATMAKKINEE